MKLPLWPFALLKESLFHTERVPLRLKQSPIIPRCYIAHRVFPRLVGLMSRTNLAPDEAMLFPKCRSVHTFFMRFPIDVVFLSNEGEVIKIFENVSAWKLIFPRRRVHHTLELAAHRSKEVGIEEGTRLKCKGVWE